MSELNYWQQLEHLKLYSLQRRRERYQIMYIWCILEGLVPAVNNVKYKICPRKGRTCVIPMTKKGPYQNERNASLSVMGARLFNILPINLRNFIGYKDKFKRKLDQYLKFVPDEPQIQGYTAWRRANSNCLIDMAKFASYEERNNLKRQKSTSTGF